MVSGSISRHLAHGGTRCLGSLSVLGELARRLWPLQVVPIYMQGIYCIQDTGFGL